MPELKTLNGYEIVDQTARDNIENLEISGRNLLVSSAKYTKDTPLVISGTSTDIYYIDQSMSTVVPIEKDQEYILQIKTDGIWGYHNTTGNYDSKYVVAWVYAVDEPFIFNNSTNYLCLNADAMLKYGIWRFTWKGAVGKYIMVRVNAYSNGSTTVTHKFWDFKLEAGHIPTKYSQSPDDIQRVALYGYSTPTNNIGNNRDIYFLL